MTKNQEKQTNRFNSEKRDKERRRTRGTLYHLIMIRSGEFQDDSGNCHCPYCGQLTEHRPNYIANGSAVQFNSYILITLSGGIIDHVRFFSEPGPALKALSDFVRTMEIEDQDAAIYTPEGCYANAKDFLDEKDEFI